MAANKALRRLDRQLREAKLVATTAKVWKRQYRQAEFIIVALAMLIIIKLIF